MPTINREILNISQQEYYDVDAISRSGLREFAVNGPLAYHAKYITKEIPHHDSDSMRLGRAFHFAMAFPDQLKSAYTIIPAVLEDDEILEEIAEGAEGKKLSVSLEPGTEINMRSGYHRKYFNTKKQIALDDGKDWLSVDEAAKLAGMVESVYASPECQKYVGHNHPENAEVTGVATDEYTGLKLKALGDLVLMDRDLIVDFKTTRHYTPNDFIKSAIYDYTYHYQAEWYCRVFGVSKFLIITVRNEPPFESMVYDVPATLMEVAREGNDYALNSLSDCIRDNSWHTLYWGAELSLTLDEGRYAQ